MANPFRYFNSSPEVIRLTVLMYVRYPLYLWRAVDHEGEVLEAVATKTRDRKAATKLLKRLINRYGRPKEIVADKLRSYGAAMKDLGLDRRHPNYLPLALNSRACARPAGW